MKYYTETIPLPLAEKLKEKGMPINISDKVGKDGHYPDFYCKNTYAEVFDWLIEKGIDIEIRLMITRYAEVESVMKCVTRLYGWRVSNTNIGIPNTGIKDGELTWHEAAEAAIEKALTLI